MVWEKINEKEKNKKMLDALHASEPPSKPNRQAVPAPFCNARRSKCVELVKATAKQFERAPP